LKGYIIILKEITALGYWWIVFGQGLSEDKIKVDLWQKDIAPSNSLRKWFGHDEKKWDEFKRRYFKELGKKRDAVNTAIEKANEQHSATLLYYKRREI
jgi:uncharacterized protein YeaO (DUF488 family)